jgi:hypothetical protein
MAENENNYDDQFVPLDDKDHTGPRMTRYEYRMENFEFGFNVCNTDGWRDRSPPKIKLKYENCVNFTTPREFMKQIIDLERSMSYGEGNEVGSDSFAYIISMQISGTYPEPEIFRCGHCHAYGTNRGIIHHDCVLLQEIEIICNFYWDIEQKIRHKAVIDAHDPQIVELKSEQFENFTNSNLFVEFISAYEEFKNSVPEAERMLLSENELGMLWVKQRLTMRITYI